MADSALADDVADQSDEGASGPVPRSSRKKLIIFIAVPVLALLVIGAGLYFTGKLGHGAGDKAEAHEERKAPKEGVFFDLPDILVNLNGAGKKSNFLKMSVSLELASAADLPRLQAVLPRIVDNFQVYLRELRVEDLKGSGGMYRLREELMIRVNAAVAPAKINDVLFKEMLVQ
jgi:flagellar FliL protein